ncbi:MAG: hypothetical protein IPG45_37480 [Deltaproteobacteria bacterium]|nr:hypothetical protein [Deltaproteobacteria bacterium]
MSRHLALVPLVIILGLTSSRAAHAQSGCVANPTLCNLNVVSTIEQADLDVAIDVVLVGDGFTNAVDWQNTATGLINQFRAAPSNMYGRFPNLFNFHVVDVISATSDVGDADTTDTALGMQVSGPYINADGGRVNLAALNAPDVDVVISVANSGSGRANANYNSQLASGGVVRMRVGGDVITHELGHALFRLADEYEEASLCNAQNESSLLLEPNVTAENSCYKFQGIAGAGCVQGGKYCSAGIWRSAGGCFMRSNTGGACPACNREIEEVLRERRSRADWAAPWVVAQVPGAGNPVSGQVGLQAQAHDDWFTPTQLSFEVDGAYVGSVTTNFGRVDLDTRRLADGPHQLAVFGADSAGYSSAARPLTFTTQNAPDAIAPTVAINFPSQGAVLSGYSNVLVQASGNTADLRDLVLSIDGVPVAAVVGQTSLFYGWDVAAAGFGSHTLSARATDYSENVGQSAIITITATSSGGPPPGAPEIQQPRDGTLVGPWFRMEWNNEGPTGGVQGGGGGVPVSLLVDNQLVMPNPLLGRTRSAVIDARSWSLGAHQLRLRVVINGVTYDSTPVLVVRGVPTNPEAFVRAPEGEGTYGRGTVNVEVAGADDVALSSIRLLVNGTSVGTVNGQVGTVAWSTLPFSGCPTLVAEAISSDGGTGRSTPLTLCVDNNNPVVTITSPRGGAQVAAGVQVIQAQVVEVGSFVALSELLVDGAVTFSNSGNSGTSLGLLANLTPGAHTLIARVTDRAGNVGTSAPVSVTAGTCVVGGCDDGNSCTTDSCGPTGACLHTRLANCCNNPADCNDGDACTTDACNNGTCSNGAIAACCNHNFDCDDADLCTRDSCSGPGGTCSHGPAECCSNTSDCNDNQACTTDVCVGAPTGFCAHDWAPGCCSTNADCDDGRACTTNSCNNGTCSFAPVANCCETSNECADNNSCTYELCNANVCQVVPIDGCCDDNADCQTLNPCAVGTCNARGSCETTVTAGCCNFDFECDDQDPCTVHACSGNSCTLVSPTDGCLDAGVPDTGFEPDATVEDDAGPGDDATLDVDATPGEDAGPGDAIPGLDVDPADLGPNADGGADAGAGLDANTQDLGTRDAAPSAPDTGNNVTAANEGLKGGCGCRAEGSERGEVPLGWWLGFGLFLSARTRRRR